MTPAVDVIVVSFNTRAETVQCVRSLVAHPPGALGSVTVVDNASADDSVAAVRSISPAVNVIALDRNAGFAAANNLAVRVTSAPLILFLNSDTIVPAGALDVLIARLIERGAVAAGPRLVDGDGRPEISFGPHLSPIGEAGQAMRVRLSRSRSSWTKQYIEAYIKEERFVDWVTGACLLVKRDAMTQAGLFDERYFMYEEDVDLCAALRRHGGRVLFTPRAEVTHLRGRSAPAAAGATRAHYDRSHLAFYEKHAPGWAPWLRLWLRLRGRVS